ncbi:zonular occludens toxin family protein [Arsenophonus nasoniae]|uniref:Zonular occludens toxin domain-containing protein n=1 Tax=Arsenophonus nasoniae TaxID=638 RepID=A0AA95GQC0_9GAMM|nr:zonular occludens toxin domain-containing protein [Arsenophonus nasoniae]WGM01633.1 zonular occludens toxin domain-containing protein [Arsenophonus nasoniae]WGM03042.1 zonular occludens toxin domain-containing protein [Arsenophonus nasoniae]
MPITAYVGVPRSGKSYEVVKSVIVPAIASGRRVVSNIYGLNEQKIKDYCLKQNKKLMHEKLGLLVHVENGQCLDEDFLPSMENQSTFCQAGDLVVIDEVWRVWGSDKDIPKNHRSFIAEHGHFINKKTGIMSDLVVINQTVTDIPRFIKARIETTYRMQKHVSLGLSNRYRVDVFQGVKITKSNRMNYYQEKYDKAIFELYKSVEGNNPNTLKTDKRQSIFSSTKVLMLMVLVPLAILVSLYFVYQYFNQYLNPEKPKQAQSVNSVSQSSNPVASFSIRSSKVVLSSKWRITGELLREGKAYVILADKQGQLRLEPRSQFQFNGRLLQGEIDGQLVNYYSGGGQ